MVSNEKRLYVALYLSGAANNEERRYHWTFLIGPEAEDEVEVPGIRYHVKRHQKKWQYQEDQLKDVRVTRPLLARILIAKTEDEERLAGIFRGIAIVQDDPDWTCRTWVANALAEIHRDGRACGASVLDWQSIETTARRYVEKKAFSGRYLDAEGVMAAKPTWDMLENREMVP